MSVYLELVKFQLDDVSVVHCNEPLAALIVDALQLPAVTHQTAAATRVFRTLAT